MIWTRNLVLVTIVGFVGVVALILIFGAQKNSRMFPLEVSFLDVGQGDAVLINYLHNYQILIDGGSSGKKVVTELSKVMPFMDDRIELIIITHPDRDHFAGLRDVINRYKVDLVLDNGQLSEDQLWKELYQDMKTKKIPVKSVFEGSYLQLGKDAEMSFFNPDINAGENKNENSVVGRLDYGENSFLFTGDVGFDTEANMITDNENIDVDWLKAGHHGSRKSSSDFFINKVSPKYSIISVGENDYGHPTSEALNRLIDSGSEILRTDLLGTITVQCNRRCSVK